jgi:hypothetical protein
MDMTDDLLNEIEDLKAIIEQMLAETGNGGNKSCGDNRLTPETIAKAKGALSHENLQIPPD